MPIYKATIAGVETPRLVRADTAAKARDHLVSTDSVTAEELADLIDAGATIEKAVDKPAAAATPASAPAAEPVKDPAAAQLAV